jgi:uncharacterized protein YneF (UPF0154 family)
MSSFSDLLPLIVIFVVLIVVGAWMSKRQMSSYGKHVAEVKAINDEIVKMNREMVAELREIKQILKDRG